MNNETITVFPGEVPVARFQAVLQGAVAPRPIAFASTVDKDGSVNLSPFSFFNVFSANPPVLVFSPSRRVRDNTTKHSLENVLEVPEVVISMVSYAMVQQMSLASTEYAKGVDEFVKAGFTPLPSLKVKPPRVAESPASFECAVKQVIPLGGDGGAGNLVVCEVLAAHISKAVLDGNGNISPFEIDLVSRMGGNWYCRANGSALFEVPKPLSSLGIGVDSLPAHIRNSKVLTGNDLGLLANVEQLPQADRAFQDPGLDKIRKEHVGSPAGLEMARHRLAAGFLAEGETEKAWQTLLAPDREPKA